MVILDLWLMLVLILKSLQTKLCHHLYNNKLTVAWLITIFCLLFLGFSADFQDCKKFDIIPEGNYDRNESSANDGNKRPLGFVKDIVIYPGTNSDVRKPCVFLTNLTSKYVEVLVRLIFFVS